jgi:hypothetical protein
MSYSSDPHDRHIESEPVVFTEREQRLAREFEHEGVTLVRSRTTPSAPSPAANDSPQHR